MLYAIGGFLYTVVGFIAGGRWLEWIHSDCSYNQHCDRDCNGVYRGCECRYRKDDTDHCVRLAKQFLVPTALFWAPLFAGIVFCMVLLRLWKVAMWVSLPHFYAKHHPIRKPKVEPVPATMVELHTEVYGNAKPEIVKMIENAS